MGATINYKKIIMRDLEDLTPELIQEVIDFVEFLKNKRMKKREIRKQSQRMERDNNGTRTGRK